MLIKSLLSAKTTVRVESVQTTTTIKETAQRLLDLRIGALLILKDDQAIAGIVSERDLLSVVSGYGEATPDFPVSSIMTRSVITCSPDDDVADILRLMNANSIRHMPVLDKGELVDMISIRELTTAFELLQKEANTDPLTGLSNRRPFLASLDNEFARSKRFKNSLSVAMIDLDHFKSVNDTYGHDAGDQVLRAFAAMMINEFRTIDHIGRLGGEEFAVIFPNTTSERASVACERLLRTARSTVVPVGRNQLTVTASIGLANLSNAHVSGAEVLKRADELAYAAKSSGRDQVKSDAA